MKLRNKQTGEIALIAIDPNHSSFTVIGKNSYLYDSLAELNAEWEDCEEPTGYWYIDFDGDILSCVEPFDEETDEKRKSISNYFETEEEAEKAVEKLKAWKRLKDKGISFEVKVIDRKWYLEPKAEPQQRTFDESHDIFKDVMIVFGGEE